jgi:ubiquinol-cytochrome c reductase cytochrome b subunit
MKDWLNARIGNRDGAGVAVKDWLNSRIGYRKAAHVLLEEPLPPGTGWFFTLGSVLLALLSVQLLTGAFLTLYYAPTPDHAYDSVRFITALPAGRIVRGLHHYGASFIVVALVLHMLRVIVFGSYKPPREVTWLSGLVLLALVLAFALTGYLLPWDQRAYWATVVTINIAQLTPLGGDLVAGILRGGGTIGALTLTRWYAAHVIFLPAALVLLVVAHVALMRRQGISGPIRPRVGSAEPFYPGQASRDITVVLLVVSALAVFAWQGVPPLEAPADPTDATYVPRPEWYFLGLFQLLKYFPGKWEVVGAMVIPGIAAGILALLPWIDRGPERDPRKRRKLMAGVVIGFATVGVLTGLGWRDSPSSAAAGDSWSLREIGGRTFVLKAACTRCHSEDGVADPLEGLPVTRAPEWIAGHVSDPDVIAPGIREPPSPLHEREAAAIVAYVRRASQQPYPGFPEQTETVGAIYARYCVGCHKIDGDGGTEGPDLTHIGSEHDAATLRRWIVDPELVDPDADMPSFGDRLSDAQLDAISAYLASQR